jgi:hypothetical protein
LSIQLPFVAGYDKAAPGLCCRNFDAYIFEVILYFLDTALAANEKLPAVRCDFVHRPKWLIIDRGDLLFSATFNSSGNSLAVASAIAE